MNNRKGIIKTNNISNINNSYNNNNNFNEEYKKTSK